MPDALSSCQIPSVTSLVSSLVALNIVRALSILPSVSLSVYSLSTMCLACPPRLRIGSFQSIYTASTDSTFFFNFLTWINCLIRRGDLK